MTRARTAVVVLLAAVVVLAGATTRVHTTDAAWTDVDHLVAPVSSAYWPTSGNARAEVGRVSSINFVVGLLSGGDPLPWAGSTAAATQASPGAVTTSGAGPYVTGGVLSLINQFRAESTAGSSIGGTVCASYSWGPASPTQCASAPQKVYSTGSLSSYRLRTSLVAGVGTVDALSVTSPISASAACNLSAPIAVNTATAAAAANATAGNQGSVQVKGNAVSIPAAGGTTTFTFGQGALASAAVSGSMTSTVTQTATSARSTLVMDTRVLRLGILGEVLLDFTFRAVLVDVACGTSGSAPTALSAGLASARVAAPAAVDAEPTSSVPVSPTPTTTPPSTTTSTGPSTTSPTTTAASTTEATTTETASATTTTVTTTTTTTTTTDIDPVPTTTLSTTTPPPSSTPATVFSGEGPVSALTTVDGRTCTANGAEPTSFSCDDGSELTFDAGDLSNPTLVDGLWVPKTIDGVPVPVKSAVRG